MKTMLLSAALVSVVIAGFVLYYEKQNKSKNRIEDAAEDAYDTMNNAIGSIERPMQHAMG